MPETPTEVTPYDLFARAIAQEIAPTVHECWIDFSYWEKARNFFDDPSHPAKAAIEWICLMEELRTGLDEFDGAAADECRTLLDQVSEAFARIQHSVELRHGIETWIGSRLTE